MICQDIVYLFRQLLQQVEQQTWLLIDDFRSDAGNLLLAFRLSTIQNKGILISSGILRRRENDDTVNNNLLQELQRQLQPDIPIQITRSPLQHRNFRNYFLSVGEPINQTSNLQLRNNLCIQRNAQKIFGYDRIITAMQELLQEDVYANDGKEGNVAQMLVEKEVEANSEVANILLELGDVNKPMLIDEELEEEYAAQQHQLQPDQLMLHYKEKNLSLLNSNLSRGSLIVM
jgi:hypothetical protein